MSITQPIAYHEKTSTYCYQVAEFDNDPDAPIYIKIRNPGPFELHKNPYEIEVIFTVHPEAFDALAKAWLKRRQLL